MTEFVASENDAGERLDRFVLSKVSDISRSQIQKHIKAGLVTVNGEQVSKHHFLKEGDSIAVADIPEAIIEEKVPVDIPVLFEDDSVVVIEKPVGVLVHPAPGTNEWTLADFVREHCPNSADVGDDPERPGIIHRLDRDVSGVMVLAKTQEAFAALKKQFQERTVQKEYRAIVHGVPSKETDVIRFAIARSKTHSGKMAARPQHEAGRDAWTEYDVLQTKNDRYAELSVRIKTGRTHQIRAHMAGIDHPIVGDKLYATKHYKNTKHEYPRIFLHAVKLAFLHPVSGDIMEWESAIPEAFTDFMA